MYQTKAFTLLESLLVLGITSFLLMAFTGGVQQTFSSVQEHLFFLSFEHLYEDSQRLSNSRQEELTLTVSEDQVSNGTAQVVFPETVHPAKRYEVTFSPSGGNSSLQKLEFKTKSGTVTYQLYIGSGRYKKTAN